MRKIDIVLLLENQAIHTDLRIQCCESDIRFLIGTKDRGLSIHAVAEDAKHQLVVEDLIAIRAPCPIGTDWSIGAVKAVQHRR